MSDAGINDIVNALSKSNLTFAGGTEVRGVSFAGKGLKLLEASDAKDIVQAIEECENLEYLNLEGNTLGIEAARSIAGALERHKEFKRALWKDMFTGRLKTEIPVALEHLSNALVTSEARLSELDLSDNAFGPIGVEGVVALLKSPCCYSLHTLKLNNNGLGIGGGKLLANALLDCHKFSQNEGKPLGLKVFIAGRNRLENEGAMALAEFFKAVQTLEQIEMPQNGIYAEAFVSLSEAIKLNQNLKIINFNDNTVGAKGAEKLSSALSQLHNLNTLNLGDCLLKTKGAKLIAKAIKNNQSLVELLLDSNEIKIEAAIDLVEAVLNKQKLKSLSINGNCFGETGAVKIREMLRKTDKLAALASLSDDEGDSDSENESDVASQDSQDSDIEEVRSSPVKSATIYDFLKCPTADVFMALGNERDNLLLKYGEKVSSSSVNNLIPLILKVASCSHGSDDTKRSTIVNTCDLLLRNLFSTNEQEMPLLNNTLMLHLGLIKSEDKKFKPTCNIEGCLYVLGSLINKNYFPVATKETLKVFLERDVDNKKEPVDVKSRLLKSL